jgi:hypothetical protein
MQEVEVKERAADTSVTGSEDKNESTDSGSVTAVV